MIPEQPEVVYEDGRPRNLDGVHAADLQYSQGEDLAQQTLELAARYYEADSSALTLIVAAAHEAEKSSDPDLSYVARVSSMRSLTLPCVVERLPRMPGIDVVHFRGDDFAVVLLEDDAATASVRLADSGEPVRLSDPPGWRTGVVPVTDNAVRLVVEEGGQTRNVTASFSPTPKPSPVRRRRSLRLVKQ